MEYIFGVISRNGVSVEQLKTVGKEHTDLTGFQKTVRNYPDSIIVDNFRIVEKYNSAEDVAGNCYDWYLIDNHNQYVDNYTPVAKQTERQITDLQMALCEMFETMEAMKN